MNKYSCSSNHIKLLKHLDSLKNLQAGKVVPIMVHAFPTNKCNLNCVHCCFRYREDKKLDMPFDDFKDFTLQFRRLGTKAIELTGGGDPTMWPYFDEGVEYLNDIGYSIGVNTNGILLKEKKSWDKCNWVRVSLNTFDAGIDIDVSELKTMTSVSFGYVWHEQSGNMLDKIFEFSHDNKCICRIAPDCITTKEKIRSTLDKLRSLLSEYKANKYVFVSDFNIDTSNVDKCYIHMIKPALYVDGNVYACPSAELSIENGARMQAKLIICKAKDIYEYYNSADSAKPKDFDCYFCKYIKQQELLASVLQETNFNEFA